MVLTQRFLFTFKAQQKYNESPTERLRVQEFVTIKSAEEIKKTLCLGLKQKPGFFIFVHWMEQTKNCGLEA
jgi:hypothetical protein